MKKAAVLLITILFGVVIQEGFAQNKPDYLSIEAQIQETFAQRNWWKVLKISQLSIDNQIDYLALRQRAGIASFFRGDFGQSIVHLNAARHFNHRDSVAQAYLYYNLLYDGRPAEAVARADANAITEGSTTNPVTGNVLTNDSDADGDTLTVSNAGTVALQYGSLTILANGG
ncbi:MAG: hypothetical protein EOP50_11425, partial [Sphingobacteriales bacterium]